MFFSQSCTKNHWAPCFLHRRVPFGVKYELAQTYWSDHLLASPPNDATLVSLFRTLRGQIPTCLSPCIPNMQAE